MMQHSEVCSECVYFPARGSVAVEAEDKAGSNYLQDCSQLLGVFENRIGIVCDPISRGKAEFDAVIDAGLAQEHTDFIIEVCSEKDER